MTQMGCVNHLAQYEAAGTDNSSGGHDQFRKAESLHVPFLAPARHNGS